jgi:hypothetical protein
LLAAQYRVRILVLILALFSTQVIAQSHLSTLAQALDEQSVPVAGLSTEVLSQNITSFSELETPKHFLIAYYVAVPGSDLLQPPLWVRLYNKQTTRWISQSFSNLTTEVGDKVETACMGSVLGMKEIAGLFVLETHINPSAGCSVFLRPQLTVLKTYYGGIEGGFSDGELLLSRSQIHFAPTHPLELDLYDSVHDIIKPIFPLSSDPAREDFMRDLRDNLSLLDCREQNLSCDPKRFETGFSVRPVFNNDTHAFAFEAQFESSGFGPTTEETVGHRRVVYVFRKGNNGWMFIEAPGMTPAEAITSNGMAKLAGRWQPAKPAQP